MPSTLHRAKFQLEVFAASYTEDLNSLDSLTQNYDVLLLAGFFLRGYERSSVSGQADLIQAGPALAPIAHPCDVQTSRSGGQKSLLAQDPRKVLFRCQ